MMLIFFSKSNTIINMDDVSAIKALKTGEKHDGFTGPAIIFYLSNRKGYFQCLLYSDEDVDKVMQFIMEEYDNGTKVISLGKEREGSK